MALEWNPKHEVGIKEFDDQHKQIFTLLNSLIEASKQADNQKEVNEILYNLLDAALEHFDAEEKAMQKYRYPDYDPHKEEHENLRLKLEGYCSSYLSGSKSVTTELIEYLAIWLEDHVGGTDMDCASWLIKHGM